METLVLDLQNISKSYGDRQIFDIDRLTVYQNDQIAIIGENGSGKSTLLKLIAEEIQPDSGTIQRETDFNYFPQIDLVNELYRADQLDSELLSRLKVPVNSVETLSGGELNKYRLAQTLSLYKMGLLLDEPTTHLDLSSVNYLIEELRYYYGALIFVSHDRHFINELADKVWEVENGKVIEYVGNYSAYEAAKEVQQQQQIAAYENYQKEKQRLEQAAAKKRESAAKANSASRKQKQRHISPDRLDSTKQKDTVEKAMHKSSKAIEKRIEQLEVVNKVQRVRPIEFPVTKQLELHNDYPIMGENVIVRRGDKLLLDRVNFQFKLKKTTALVGDNGSGKSSLINYILDNNEGITISPKAVIEVYQQMDYQLTAGQSVLKYLMSDTEYQEPFVRAILQKLGFNQIEVNKSLAALSGGEATRLALAKLFVRPSNVIILDEPTNFIDLTTIQALQDFILAYPGTVLLTSHDQTFVEAVSDEIYEITRQTLQRLK